MGQLVSRRYAIRGVLGQGGTGVVYEAYDSKDDTVVALKTIESRAAENLYRLKHEFRALADVQHRNLVRFGELSCEEGQWFFSMELVRGKNFIEYVRPLSNDAPRTPSDGAGPTVQTVLPESGVVETAAGPSAPSGEVRFDEGRLRASLGQLVSALATLHEAGHVHRDVKPSNVLVADDGRVVLLDFGLVTALAARPSAGEEGWVIGTPAFMAPEQAGGHHAVGPETDWYSVGVMLFLALTGTFPFGGATSEIIDAKLSRPAPAPHDLIPSVPAVLDQLCVDLLHTDPALRPTVSQIRARLGIVAEDAVSTGAFEVGSRFVGRDVEMGGILRAFQEAMRGDGTRVVVIEGEPGMGKSSLVQNFLSTLPESVLVLSGRCYEQETVPFKGVDSMVDALSEWLLTLPDAEVQSIIRGGVRYLASVFPVLNRVGVVSDSRGHALQVANPSALREQAFGEFERLIAALASRGPLVLYLDDLQWTDQDSSALLRRALFHSNGAPCLFLATMRTGMEPSAMGVTELLASAERIPLRGLSEPESRELLDSLWTERLSRRDVSSRDVLMREAEGHPLFLAELVRSARAGHARPGSQAKLQDVLWSRIQDRDALDRKFLEYVAVAGAPTPYEVVSKAAGVDVGESQTRLGSLRAAQLIRVSRRGDERLVEPYHDRVRESILHHLESGTEGEAALASRHLRLGRTLLADTREEQLSARIFAIVLHLNAARDLLSGRAERVRLAGLNVRACREAQRATAYERARAYARAGLELLADDAWKDAYEVARDLHFASMAAELYAGDSAAAKERFEAAREHVASASDRTNLYVSWVGLQTSRGQFQAAIQTGRERLGELGLKLRPTISTVGVLHQYSINRIAQGRRTTDELLHSKELEDPTLEAVLVVLIAIVPAAFFVSTNLLVWCQLKIAEISLRHGVSRVSAYGFVGQGTAVAGAFEKYPLAGAYGRLALALDGRFRNEALGPKLHCVYGGWIASWTLPFREAKASLRKAFELANKLGDTPWETYSATVLSVVSFCESADLPGLAETAAWAREIGAQRKDRDMAGVPDAHARYAAALRGATASRLDLGIPGSTDAEFRASLGDKTPTAMFYYLFCNAELAYHAGDVPRAAKLVAEAAQHAHVIFSLPTTVELWLLEALVAARQHDSAPWMERLRLRRAIAQRADKLHRCAQSCPENFEAHDLIAGAELARVRGAAKEADAAFERAVTAARAHRTTKREAIALELASAHAATRGDAARAQRLRADAADAYRRWGAIAKADALVPSAGSVAGRAR